MPGTDLEFVSEYYIQTMFSGAQAAQALVTELLESQVGLSALQLCPLSNISVCSATAAGVPRLLALYNPLPWDASMPVTVPVPSPTMAVYTPEGEQLSAVGFAPSSAPVVSNETLPWLMSFLDPAPVPAFGYRIYRLEPASMTPSNLPAAAPAEDAVLTLENDQLQVHLKTGTA